MAIDFITVLDANGPDEEGYRHQSSLGISDNDPDNRLQVIGGMEHGRDITFDKKNAQKMIDFCQKIIDES
jgi:hypothetical protein